MTDTPQQLPIEIKNRWDDSVIYTSKTATTLRDAVIEAVAGDANLRDANLSGAELSDADLRGAELSDANLSGANLSGANLSGAELRGAELRGANLSDANLRGAELRGAELSDADLSDADLRGAELSDADLRGAELGGKKVTATASVQFTGHGQCGRTLTAAKTDGSVYLWCGCFYGSPDKLRTFIAGDNKDYAKTRTLALDTVLMLLDAKN